MKKLLLVLLAALLNVGATQDKITWVAIGDSITYLNDHQDETGNRVTKGYLTLITEKYPGISYINQGHNGWTSVNIAERIESLGLVKADIYTVFLGTNDWWQGKQIGTFADYENQNGSSTVYGSFRVIINKLKELNKSAQIILITPLQRGDFVYINNPKNNAYGSYKPKRDQSLEQVASAIVEIGASEKFEVVDLYHDSGITQENMVNFKRLKDPVNGGYKDFKFPEYTTVPYDPEKDDYPYPVEAINMTYDGLHPSDKGYQVIAEKLLAKWKGLN